MTRLLTPEFQAALEADVQHLVIAAFFDFGPNPSDAAFYHNDVGNIVFDPFLKEPFDGERTFIGAGNIARVSPITEDSSDRPSPYVVELRGVDMDLIRHVRSLNYRGRRAKIWHLAVDPLDGSIINFPDLRYGGRIQRIRSRQDDEGIAMQIAMVDQRSLLSRGKGTLVSNTQQQARHPGDKGLAGMAKVDKKTVTGSMKVDISPITRGI